MISNLQKKEKSRLGLKSKEESPGQWQKQVTVDLVKDDRLLKIMKFDQVVIYKEANVALWKRKTD